MIPFHKFRIFAATLLVLSICFFKWEPFGSPYTNGTFLSFFLYFFACLFSIKKSFSLKFIKPYLIPALTIWGIFFAMSMINYVPNTVTAFSQIRQLLMQLIFFWIFFNELLFNPALREKLLHVFIYSLVLLSFFFILGIGAEIKDGRLALFGVNANLLGFWFALAIPILIRSIVENKVKGLHRLFYILLIPLFVFLMARTGSRGAAVTLAIAITTYFTFIKQSFESKVLILISGLVIAAVVSVAILQVDIMRQRFLDETGTEDLGSRLPIWEVSFEIISENPLFGVGTTKYEEVITQKMANYRAPHNTYLSILVYGGIASLFLFFVLLRNLIKDALRYNDQYNSPLAITLIVAFLVNFVVAGGLLYSFVTWFIFAYIASSGVWLKIQRSLIIRSKLLRRKLLP